MRVATHVTRAVIVLLCILCMFARTSGYLWWPTWSCNTAVARHLRRGCTFKSRSHAGKGGKYIFEEGERRQLEIVRRTCESQELAYDPTTTRMCKKELDGL